MSKSTFIDFRAVKRKVTIVQQHGLCKVIALMSSSMSPVQDCLIRKLTVRKSDVIVMLDEEAAGQEAREEIAGRLAKFSYVKGHQFNEPELQPEPLSFEEVQNLTGGAS